MKTEVREYTATADTEAIQQWRYWAGLLNTAPENAQPQKDRAQVWWRLAGWFALCAAVALMASWCVGVNTFSLHGLYGNRLIRCYLGASRPKEDGRAEQVGGRPANSGPPPRHPNPITGFDPLDDLALHSLRIEPPQPPEELAALEAGRRPYRGPYLLVNTALNLVQGEELAWQERQAEAFLLSPEYCGSKSTGYRVAEKYAGGVTLGNAVTVSGAAASPNMGYHSSPVVTALLTVFNVRLGAWFGNPNQRAWRNEEPSCLWQLFKELFGRTNRHSRYVYLSDGGHFENLGVYELVRRHCRFIVACDSGQDSNYDFDDLGNLIRKCRSDLGVTIEIDVTPIKPRGEGGHSQWHCAIGTIRYDAIDPEAAPGLLIYLKSSLTGDEPSDVLNYAVQHQPFPHQSTADQFFTESQFESYRALGLHVAHRVFGDALEGLEDTEGVSDAIHCRSVRRLFSNLHRRWFPPLPQLEEGFLESVKAWMELDADLREDANLRDLSLSLYPELAGPPAPPAPAPPAPADASRAELLVVSQMLQVMENAWLGVHLEGYYAHPMNRGWMNTFRRWVSSETFRKHWLTLRGEYSQDFVRFCEEELKLDHGQPWAYPFDAAGLQSEEAWQALQRDFRREWPGEMTLDELAQQALQHQAPDGGRLAVWLVALAPRSDPHPEQWTAARYPLGVVLVRSPTTHEDYELFGWLRGPYRNLGIAREAFEELFPRILAGLEALPETRSRLRVRYPTEGRRGSADRTHQAMWQSFFYQYGFRPCDPHDPTARDGVILRRPLYRPRPSPLRGG